MEPEKAAESVVDEVLRGDAYEPPADRNGKGHGKPEKAGLVFPTPIPASLLQRAPGATWLVHGYLARGSITLLSALWKSGKTTWLAHLVKALATGNSFCGLDCQPGSVLYITEESETRWADRRDALGIQDNVEFLIRPFRAKPDWPAWLALLRYLKTLCVSRPRDLILFDTLSNLWPVRDENDAPQVQAALMPLHDLSEHTASMLVHHNRKGDGQEATASRGSGALPAFVDTILELRRYNASDRSDRRRVLTGYGRWDETPEELVIELSAAGYTACGDRRHVASVELTTVICRMLPGEPPGMTAEEIAKGWPGDEGVRRQRLIDALNHGADTGIWHREGDGVRGSPYTFWAPAIPP